MKKGVVILHGGGLGEYCQSFDVLVWGEYLDEYRWVEEELYKVECGYVKKFLEENEGYQYIGSGDFQTICAVDRIKLLTKLLVDGFEFKCQGVLD